MLNCIIATTRPNARMKRPSTPVSFMRRRMISASCEVRISRNSRFASGSCRTFGSISRSDLLAMPHGVGMQHQIVLLREAEHPDEIDRIAREHVLVGDGQAIVVVEEILALGQRRGGRGAEASPSSGSAPERAWPAGLRARSTGSR